MKASRWRESKRLALALVGIAALIGAVVAACGGETKTVTEIQTVVVEKQVTQIEKVIETVVVEKKVEGETVRVVETVVVEKPVTRTEKVVETVVVERVVEGKTVKVVETVIVEKSVTRIEKVVETVVVEKVVVQQVPGETKVQVVEVEKVVVATPVPTLFSADGSSRISPQGHFVLADTNVPPPVSVPALAGTGFEMSYYAWGVMEMPLFQNEEGLIDPAVSLWTSWTLDPDQSKISWTLRKGVQFHGGWGELTAEDVVFSHNNANSDGTRFYGFGDNTWMGGFTTTGRYTGEMAFAEFNPRWAVRLSNAQDHQPWIISKALYDSEGEDAAVTQMIGTGPYEAKSWVSRDRVELEAIDEHWRVVPKTQSFNVVEIAEPLAMQAAFLTGEVDIAPIPNSLIKDTLARTPGSTFRPIGRPDTQMIHYTGNFWLKGELLTNEGMIQFPRPAYAEALAEPDRFPWIGNIDDPASMERALKVRTAMTMAIDQDKIVRNVFDGFGTPYATQFGFKPDDPYWKDEWAPPAYDPEGAKALLTEAGYPDGFSFPMFIPSDARTISAEAAFAASQMWREIGLDPVIDNGTYASGRDRRFDGQDNIIRMHHIYTGDLDGQRGEGMGLVQTWYSTELPRTLLDLLKGNTLEPDQAKRIQNNITGQDFLSQQRLFLPLSVISQHYMFRPEIADYRPHFTMSSQLMAPWTVEVRR